MIVLCFEGCHGVGKSTLCGSFSRLGFEILDEGICDAPSYLEALHPQSLLMETMWVCNWFKRVLQKKANLDKRTNKLAINKIIVADRSPFSAVFYSKNGQLLEPIVREHVKELKAVGIQVITISIDVDKETLWSRIQARLKMEPWREKYHEGELSWMLKTKAFYDNFNWDCTIQNNSLDFHSLNKAAFKAICDLGKSSKVLSKSQQALFDQFHQHFFQLSLAPQSEAKCPIDGNVRENSVVHEKIALIDPIEDFDESKAA